MDGSYLSSLNSISFSKFGVGRKFTSYDKSLYKDACLTLKTTI